MKKNILMIDPSKILYKNSQYSLGFLIIFERLSKLPINVKLFDTTKNALSERDGIVNEIISFNPSVICMTTRSDIYPFCIDLAHRIKVICKEIYIVLGGPQATLTHSQTLEFSKDIDVIVRGAGEEITEQVILSEFCYERMKKIPNISYNDITLGKVVVTETLTNKIQPITPINSILRYNITSQTERVDIEAGRGCTFGCTFCVTSKVWNMGRVLREPLDIVNDIILLTEHGKEISEINFTHDNLLLNKKYSEEFIFTINKMMPKHLSWSCSVRIDLLDEDLIKKMKLSRCCGVYLGVETGSEKMQKVYNKNINLVEALNNLMLLNKYGIKFIVSLIIGHPLETKEDIFETLLFAIFARNLKQCKMVQIHKLAVVYGADFYEDYENDLIFEPNKMSDQSTDLINENDRDLIISNKNLFSCFYSLINEKYDMSFGDKTKLYQLLINSCPTTLKLIKNTLGHDVLKSILMTEINDTVDFARIVESYIGKISIIYDSCAKYELKVLELRMYDYNKLTKKLDKINTTYRLIDIDIDFSTNKYVKSKYIIWLQSNNSINFIKLDNDQMVMLNAILTNQISDEIRESKNFKEWKEKDLIW